MDTETNNTPLPDGPTGAVTATDTQEPDPFLQSAGSSRNDPFWDEMMDSIRRHRREMDAQWDRPE